MNAEPASQTCSPKYSIPPPWYGLQTSRNGHVHVPLPAKPTAAPIYLTTFRPDDVSALQATLDTPSVNDRLISVPKPYTLSDAKFWVNLQLSGSSFSALPLQALRANDPESGTLVGAVSLMHCAASMSSLRGVIEYKPSEYELGYYLHPDFQRQGIMRYAVLALLAWAMEDRGVKEVVVNAAVENEASTALIESLEGFERVGGETEVEWPETKGGGMKKLLTWRWKCR